MSKGSTRRQSQVSDEQLGLNWDAVFNGKATASPARPIKPITNSIPAK